MSINSYQKGTIQNIVLVPTQRPYGSLEWVICRETNDAVMTTNLSGISSYCSLYVKSPICSNLNSLTYYSHCNGIKH